MPQTKEEKAAYNAEYYAANADKRKAYRAENSEKIKDYRAEYRAANADKIKAYRAEYHAANPDKRKAYMAEYRTANADKIKADSAEYHSANSERIKAAQAIYRADNPDKIKAGQAAYRQANPEARRRFEHKRRALKMNCGGVLSKGLTEKLLLLQHGKCACCKKSVKAGHHLDHIMPLALGGANEDSNIQILCPTCNCSKGAKDPQDFMQSRGFLF